MDQKTNQMIKHPSSVTNLRQLEDHLLMVGGRHNSVPHFVPALLILACDVRSSLSQERESGDTHNTCCQVLGTCKYSLIPSRI